MLRTATSLAALTLVAALALTGCAAEQAPTQGDAPATSTPSPTPEEITYAAGDVVDAAAADAINADTSDLTVAYPVGDSFVVVTWGEPIAESVIKQVDANVNASSPDYGTIKDGDQMSADFYVMRDALDTEAEKLGGMSVFAVTCTNSYSMESHAYEPTWIIPETRGPSGLFSSWTEAVTTADAYVDARPGKAVYVVINNLGCAQ